MTLPLIGLDPVLGEYAARVRKTYGRLTPFRLGMEVGAAGVQAKNPYEPRSKAARLFYEGVNVGRELRAKRGETATDNGKETSDV